MLGPMTQLWLKLVPSGEATPENIKKDEWPSQSPDYCGLCHMRLSE